MSRGSGWVCVKIPEVLGRAGRWQIWVGQTEGIPHQVIAVPAGIYQVIIGAVFDWQQRRLTFKLALEVFVADGSETHIHLPISEQIVRELLKLVHP